MESMSQTKRWSCVIYQVDSILPRKVYDCEPSECISDSLERDKERTNRIPFYGSPSNEAHTAHRDAFTYYMEKGPCSHKWKQLHVGDYQHDNLLWNAQVHDEQVCDSCQMHICSSCGNPFSDEEYSSSSVPIPYDTHISSDHELTEWRRKWPFQNKPDQQMNLCRDQVSSLENTGYIIQKSKMKISLKRKRSDSNLSIDQLSRYFDLPRKEAAQQLGVCVTLLKRRCRELGIHCWPFRKMRCLDDRIRHLQIRKEQSISDVSIDQQIRILQQRRQSLLKNPNISLQQLLGDEDEISWSGLP
ncbi:hypothetical protein Gasu2_42570 [Galdieria sulphuraria]|nr:hypothetical protein Gasu2_42570 [Galdieria sulphuraria]